MSNASYYNIKNVPSQLQFVDVANLNVADTVTASVLNSDVSTGSVPFTFVPLGKQLQKVTLYTPTNWLSATTSKMVTEKGGTIEFEFPEEANIVAAHLERQDHAIDGTPTFDLTIGSKTIMATVTVDTVNTQGLGAKVSVYEDTNQKIGGTGAVNIQTVTKGSNVMVELISAGSVTHGDLFACIYYYL